MLILIINHLTADNGNMLTNNIILKFHSPVNVSKNNQGIVTTGFFELDSLNTVYNCQEYALIDYAWSKRLRNILVLGFSEEYDVFKILTNYQEKLSSLCVYIEAESDKNQYLTSIPGDYLISPGLQHDQDVFYRVSEDADKKYWFANNFFSWVSHSDSTNGALNVVNYPLFRDTWETDNPISLLPNPVIGGWAVGNPNNYIYGYSYKMYGKFGTYHLTKEYNNTLKAWEYSKGKNIDNNPMIVVVADPYGFKVDHPDLEGQFLPSFYDPNTSMNLLPPYLRPSTQINHSSMQPIQVHGTNIAGAICAKAENASQGNNFNILSSVGVAPEVKLFRAFDSSHSLSQALEYLIVNNLVQYTKSLSLSY